MSVTVKLDRNGDWMLMSVGIGACVGLLSGVILGRMLALPSESRLARERDEAVAKLEVQERALRACSQGVSSALPLMESLLGPGSARKAGPWRPFMLTAYCERGGSGLGRTKTWEVPQEGRTVAVDPAFVPLGSSVFIRGLGLFKAVDVGGGVRGPHLDVFMSSCADASRFEKRAAVARIVSAR